jgi:heavy metal sensor kinase
MRSVASRLTLHYSGAFAATAAVGLTMAYFMTSAYLTHESDAALRYFREEISAKFSTMDRTTFRNDMLTETAARGTGEVVVRVVSASGELVFSSRASSWRNLPDPAAVPGLATSQHGRLLRRTGAAGGHDARMLYARLGDGHAVEIGLSEKDHETFLRKLRWAAVVIFALMLAAGAVVGWAMARRAMSEVNAVTAAAARIAEGDLGPRVPVGREGREIHKLASTFNSMAERIQTLITKMKETNDNIAHDLRSPVTRMRCNAEMPLLGGFTEEEYQKYAAKIIEDCDRLLSIVNTTLDISELEAGVAGVKRERVDIAQICRDGAELYEALAEAQAKTLTCSAAGPAYVQGEAGQLQRVVATLLDNAVKYTEEGCSIRIAVATDAKEVSLSVTDDGPGIAQEDLARIFERFYRADRSRSQSGNGLGLSLARAIVEAQGGTLRASSVPRQATTFTAVFPAANA